MALSKPKTKWDLAGADEVLAALGTRRTRWYETLSSAAELEMSRGADRRVVEGSIGRCWEPMVQAPDIPHQIVIGDESAT
jgi:hypothetical protein